jgi:hypothetical protein
LARCGVSSIVGVAEASYTLPSCAVQVNVIARAAGGAARADDSGMIPIIDRGHLLG